MSPGWAKQKLAKIEGAAADVASYEVGVHSFKVRWRKDVAP